MYRTFHNKNLINIISHVISRFNNHGGVTQYSRLLSQMTVPGWIYPPYGRHDLNHLYPVSLKNYYWYHKKPMPYMCFVLQACLQAAFLHCGTYYKFNRMQKRQICKKHWCHHACKKWVIWECHSWKIKLPFRGQLQKWWENSQNWRKILPILEGRILSRFLGNNLSFTIPGCHMTSLIEDWI